MKLITQDFIIDEEEYMAYRFLELIYGKYASKIPQKSKEHLEQTIKYLLEDIEKGYPDDLDITDSQWIERLTFDLDTGKFKE